MRAFIHAVDPDTGQDMLGTDNSMVTNEYKTVGNLLKHAVQPFMDRHGSAHVEIFYDWGNRYGEADQQFTFYQGNSKYAYPRF